MKEKPAFPSKAGSFRENTGFRRPYPTPLISFSRNPGKCPKGHFPPRRGKSLQQEFQSENRGFSENTRKQCLFSCFRRPELSETPRNRPKSRFPEPAPAGDTPFSDPITSKTGFHVVRKASPCPCEPLFRVWNPSKVTLFWHLLSRFWTRFTQ